jgi:tetratricopeptide (TPR) repeat protein
MTAAMGVLRSYVQMARGIAAYNIGENETARNAYARAAELRSSVRGHLYLADAHRRVGDEQRARRHSLRALKMQPTLVDARRGYWHAEAPGTEPPHPAPWFDRPSSGSPDCRHSRGA